MHTCLPHGVTQAIQHPSFTKDEEHGWIWGNNTEYSPAQTTLLHDLMASHKHCFAYSNGDLPGYCGSVKPATIDLVHDHKIFEQPRRHSPIEVNIEYEKCADLAKNGIISKAPTLQNKYASNNTLPSKKDMDGNHTDRRMCTDLRALN